MQLVDLSIVIPAYTITPDLEEKCISTILSYVDDMAVEEIIVSEDGGFFSPQILDLVDIYIYNKKNTGFTAAVNRGWNLATGDYTAIVNSDTLLRKGELKDLCIPGKVTSPEILGQTIEHLGGPFFVVPRDIKEERGMLLTEMVNYCSDSDYDHRVRDIFQKVPSVKVFHHVSSTVKAAGMDVSIHQKKDRKIYNKLKKEGKAS